MFCCIFFSYLLICIISVYVFVLDSYMSVQVSVWLCKVMRIVFLCFLGFLVIERLKEIMSEVEMSISAFKEEQRSW